MTDFPDYDKNRFDEIFPGIRERDNKIASLITTIESQKEEIKRLLAVIAEKEDKSTDYFDQEGEKP